MPHYPIDPETLQIILGLKHKCDQLGVLGLDNVSFEYPDATFVISKYRTHWELIVRSILGECSDIYMITGNELEFKRTEVD